MITIYEPTINLIKGECGRLILERKELKESVKKGSLSSESFAEAAKAIDPIIVDFHTAITTLRIQQGKADNEQVGSLFSSED